MFGPLALVARYKRIKIQDAFDYFVGQFEDDDILKRVKKILMQPDNKTIYENEDGLDMIPPGSKRITIPILTHNKHLKELFDQKQLHSWDIDRYNLKIWNGDVLIIPFYFKGKIVSYQKRWIEYKRYGNPENAGKYIYWNRNILPDTHLILVEGFFDLTRIYHYILTKKINISITTGFLKSISKEQINKIIKLNPKSVIVMFDNDSWFNYNRIKKELPFDVHFTILPKGKDPNELGWRELKKIFNEEINPICSRSSFRSYG